MGDDKVNAIETRLDDLFKLFTDQFEHGRKHFEALEEKLDTHIEDDKIVQAKFAERLTVLERAKIYFDGMRQGAIWAIGTGIAAVVTAAVWIINKIQTPAG